MKQIFLAIALMMTTACNVAFAGVGAFEGDENIGVYANVKCAENIKCSKSGSKLELNVRHKAVATFTSGDSTPSIANGTYFNTHTTSGTITTFDDGVAGKEIIVHSKGAITYDVTSTTLKCGTTDLVTASGDILRWLFDGTDWYCLSFIDQSDNLN